MMEGDEAAADGQGAEHYEPNNAASQVHG